MDLRFSCVPNCGKCCHGSTQLRFFEALRLSGDLPLGLVVVHSGPPNRFSKPEKEYLRSIFERLADQNENKSAWITGALGTVIPSDVPCPFLADDAKCRLHDDGKPLRCGAMPLPGYSFHPDNVRTTAVKHCPPEALIGSPIIQDGRIVDKGYRQVALRESDAARREKHIFAIAILFGHREGLLNVFDIRNGEYVWQAGPAVVALAAVFLGIISRDDAMNFCGNQSRIHDAFASQYARRQDYVEIWRAFSRMCTVICADIERQGGRAWERMASLVEALPTKYRKQIQ